MRSLIVCIIVGALIALCVSWTCTLWSPVRSQIDPFPNPTSAADATDPDGHSGLYYQETGFGWRYLWLRGERSYKDPSDYFWSGPYGGEYHRLAGWPLPALRSRVSVLDSQGARRFDPDDLTQQRHRWNLPLGEILYRGVATNDLSAWLHAKPDRRLPLVPMPLGFAVDSLTYALCLAAIIAPLRILRRRVKRSRRGFGVVIPQPDPQSRA